LSPLALLVLAFVLVPLVELYLLIQVGSAVGAITTIALCLFTAIAGATLLRAQGLSTLLRVQQMLDRGEMPAVEVLEGAVLLISGALLLTPGFVTDAIGFACLVPPLRRTLILGWLRRRADGGPRAPHPGGRVIEGEFERQEDEKLR
jgi:UPF0716 protein FxsA